VNFINTLAWWQWLILAAIPPAIVALYFLKLKRAPLEVPSTYLWRRTIEDLHVNSLWQRLRRNILLLLQLLVVFLVMFALLRPGWQSEGAVGNRFVILIDNSASMSSKDVEPTRLEQAKEQAAQIIAGMDGGDAAMIMAFNDGAVPVQQFTENKFELQRRLESIAPTNRTSDISEALQLAAGLANPGRQGEGEKEVEKETEAAVAEAHPAELFIFTDGRFNDVANFDFGNLNPQYFIVGDESASNVGITAFSVARNEDRPSQMQAVCRIQNFGPQEVDRVQVSIYLNDETTARDAAEVELDEGAGGYAFDLFDIEGGTLRLRLDYEDDFPTDNVAYAAVNAPRRANVLLVSPGNDALTLACKTPQAAKAANVEIKTPRYLEREEYAERALSAFYDLVIYDQCAPERMPAANTLFIGSPPPGTRRIENADAEDGSAEGDAEEIEDGEEAAASDALEAARRRGVWLAGPKQPAPAVIDVDRTHPLMRYIELGNVRIAEATPLKAPPGGNNLIDADIGTIFAIAPRKSFEDAVLGFEIVGVTEQGDRYANTDWPIRRSFPLFVINCLEYLGGQQRALSTGSVKPGKTIAIRTDTPAIKKVVVRDPAGGRTRLDRQEQAVFSFSKTDQLGVYEVYEGDAERPTQRFAVNMFDPRESNLVPRGELQVGQSTIAGQRHWQPMRFELWKWILIGSLGLLLAEWWIWNRRVYL